MSEPKILFLDIEATGLVADFGITLCVGYKWKGNKRVFCPAIFDYKEFDKDPTAEEPLLRDIYKVISAADMLVTYYGTNYDKKFLTAKFMEYNVGPWPNVPHLDLFYTVKSNFALSRKSLQNAGYYLGLSNEKSAVEGRIWRRAQAGHRDAIRYIIKHCKADVLILEELYERIKPLARRHPRVASVGTCPVCGSNHLQRRGTEMNRLVGKKVRLSCQGCGHWFTIPEKQLDGFRAPATP